jgi:hypothetical protein
MNRPMTYILVGQTPVPEDDPLRYAEWRSTADRIVRQDKIGTSFVSTVFLGIDHNWRMEGPPLLFETMIWTDSEIVFCDRCATWLEAEQQHERVLEDMKGKLPR